MYLLLVDPAAAELTTHPHCRVGTPASTRGRGRTAGELPGGLAGGRATGRIMSTIVDRAARRGEVPTGTDAAEAIRAVTRPALLPACSSSASRPVRRPPTAPRPFPPPPATGRSALTHDPGKGVSPGNDCLEAAEHPARRVAGLADLGGGAEPNGGYVCGRCQARGPRAPPWRMLAETQTPGNKVNWRSIVRRRGEITQIQPGLQAR
jgi:hypothetical protein